MAVAAAGARAGWPPMDSIAADEEELPTDDGAVQLAVRFAEAIAEPGSGAFLLGRDNKKVSERIPLAQAARDGRAFVVSLHEEVAAVDCDDPGKAAEAEGSVRELGPLGLSPILVASGREDHFHVLVRVQDPSLRRVVENRLRKLGTLKRSMRPPLSPHRLGGHSRLVQPALHGDALSALRFGGPRPLRECMAEMLLSGQKDYGDRTRSGVMASLAMACLNAGWPFECFEEVMLLPGHMGGARVQEATSKEADRQLRLAWRSAAKRIAERPAVRDRESAEARILAVSFAVEAVTLQPRTEGTDRNVLLAHVAIARKCGKLRHDASVRDIANLAGVGRSTVSRSHKRLVKLGLLRRVRSGDRLQSKADRWEVTVPDPGLNPGHTSHAPPEPLCVPPRHSSSGECVPGYTHDVWTQGGLGRGVAATHRALVSQAAWSEVGLASNRGVTTATVRRHLAKLESAGLAVADALGWRAEQPADLERAAVRLGVQGTLERRRRAMEQERTMWRDRQRGART